MHTDTVIFMLLAAVLSVALAFYMYGFRSKLSKNLRWTFGVLRFLSVFLLLLLFINPKIENATYYTVKPTLAVLVDNSNSIKFLEKENEVSNLVEALKNDTKLNERFDIAFYSFDKGMETLDSLSFSEKQTHISQALKTAGQIHRAETAPIVLITDGNQTFGSDYEFTAGTLKDAVFPVIVGDTTVYADLYLSRINANRYAYIKNEFPVEAFAVYVGDETVNTSFEIRQGSAVLYHENLLFTPEENSKTIQFTLPANKVGVQQFTAVIQPLETEKNKTNNSRQFAVEVIDQATNVLLVSDLSHPDIGAWKKAITSNEQRKVTLVKPEDAVSQLENSQLVILYQPNNRFNDVIDAVERLNLNSLIVSGLKTEWNFLNRKRSDFVKRTIYPKEDVQAFLNSNYAAFSVEDIGFERFPPLQTSLGNMQVNVPFDVLLGQQINGIDTETPLLFSFENDSRKTAVFDGEGLWRWRANSYVRNGDFQSFDNFIGNFVQYLSSAKRSSRLEVEAESFYNSTGNIKVRAQYFDRNYVFDSRASLHIALKNTETEAVYNFPLLLRNNFYEVNLSNLPPGTYNYTVNVANENVSRSGSFQIIDFNMEQQFLNPDAGKLQRVAAKTGGKSYYISNATALVSDLTNDNRYSIIEKSTQNIVPLTDWKILLFILAALLGVEWFIRKYNGLV